MIANGVAAQIVDPLEAVEVENKECVAVIARVAFRGRCLEPRQQRAPIGEPGQRVLHRKLTQRAYLGG